jgi:hypothetical protein
MLTRRRGRGKVKYSPELEQVFNINNIQDIVALFYTNMLT